MSVFKDEKIWRMLTNFWTYVFLVFLCANFFMENKFESLIGPMAIIYTGILGLYVGTKEFDRWYDMHADNRHPGENFVVAWSIVIFALMILSVILGGNYKVSSEAVASYIMVLSVFALTQKSKALYRRKKEYKTRQGTEDKL